MIRASGLFFQVIYLCFLRLFELGPACISASPNEYLLCPLKCVSEPSNMELMMGTSGARAIGPVFRCSVSATAKQ